ncbi:diiron oxygenase [Nocardia sp. BSTN01]|uniref:AurF N-oxygenase family protein n=1 Tax=Nocardia sp. BSTN01 TaxID=2783665 RepID=UPI00188EA80C|nr:diiron oxygenase [Nocardia sp. BSTN01]MBF5000512.1 diiron oxygenase [Nocardia sp. BSTN01]
MTTFEVEAPRSVVNNAGISTTTLKNVGDRQKTAQRLLRSTADRSYDGELDINWDAPLDPEKKWIPDHRQTLYGSRLWATLTDEQRRTLGMHEMVAILSFGIMAEVGLSTMLLRGVLESDEMTDDHSRYALAEVAEETRHSTMFSRLVNLSELEPYRQPSALTWLYRVMGFIPRGPSVLAGTLLIEELLDRFQREAMNDPELQPHLRQMMKIHILEEARHITYAREELVRAIQARGKAANAWHRGLFALQNMLVQPVLVNPKVYRSVGIHPLKGFLTAMTSKEYRSQAIFRSEPLVRYLHEVGMIRGPVTTRLYKWSRSLPDDLLEQIERERSAA